MRAVIYARVSYDDRDTDGRNLAGQLEMGRAFCHKNGYEVISELAEDIGGASGAEINLPRLNHALEMARAGLFDVLIVRELDRLSRDVGKLYIVEKELRRYRVGIEYVLYDFPDNPSGQLMKNIYASFAQFEREEIRLRMMRGKRNKVNDGSVMTPGAPYGYRIHKSDKNTFEMRPAPHEAAIVRQVFTWYAREFITIREIVRRLDAMGAPIPESGGMRRAGGWPRSTVFKILRSKTYAGEWDYTYDGNERLTVNVPPIVDLDLWEATQAILDENKAVMARSTKYEYLFGRRLTCGKCGHFMACEPQHSHGKLYLYYVCPGEAHDRRGGCKGYRIPAVVVDAIAWEWISDILKDPEKLQNEIDIYQTRAARENAPVLEKLQITDELLAEHRGKLGRLVDLYLSGTYALEDLQERKSRLESTIKSLEDQRGLLTAALAGQALTPEQIDDLQAFASEIRDRLDTASYQERVQLMHILDVTALLTLDGEDKVLLVQCIIRPKPDAFMIDVTATRRPGPGTAA